MASICNILTAHTGPQAVGAPNQPWLSGPDLLRLATETQTTLNHAGIGRGDRLAIVLPNGPQMATAFVSIAACCTAAPLNPAYKTEEFTFYLNDLKPCAIVLMPGDETPARTVAEKLGLPVIHLYPMGASGTYRLETALTGTAAHPGPAEPSEMALVLHTSGTTARPKIVPLTNGNLAASARHIAQSLALTPADICLNVMPLFHIHGLIAAVLSSLHAGASVACTPGFNAFKFAEWVEAVHPTWYTAVPTMHQAVLMRARSNKPRAQAMNLRFIRSSSASLPPQVMLELEDVFGSPVIEAYGMTEAAHQMCANPLPPRARKPGAVGIAAGPEIAVMDDAGILLPQGHIGEVVIRGPNVTPGYDNNPQANARAFTAGWFRTGDQGRIDDEGYLFLTGRLKEQINRGGEKISPLEVDTILLDHPALAQVVTFAIPHDKLGEEVGAVVVCLPGQTVTEQEIRDFAATRLAAFKVPRRVLIMEDVPKGATGKVQRIGLAQKLGLVP